MSKKYKKPKTKVKMNVGLIVLSIGAGLILAVLIPFWTWILVIGAGLIAGGWYLIQNSGHR